MIQQVYNYKPRNKKEREARRMVWERYRTMRDDPKRKEAEEQWELGDKMFLQWSAPREEDDWRAHVTLPDGFAAVQTHMQETIERRTRPLLKPVEFSDDNLQLFGNAILSHNMDVTGYDYQDYLAKQTAAIRGTAYRMETYRFEKREVQDLTGVDEDGKLTYTKKEIVDADDTFTEWVDNYSVFTDPGASDQNEMRDYVYREIIDWDEFQRTYNLRADFMNIKDVPKAGKVDDRSQFFERAKDIEDDEVEVLHYYNRAIDAYYVLANNVLIRMTPIPYKHKELNLVVDTHYNVPGQLYGLGIPKVIFSLTEERKSLRNLHLDRQHLQGDKMFLVNDLVDLDEEDARSRPHALVPINTNGLKLSDVIMPVEHGDTPVSYYKSEDMLLEDIRRAHGIDDRLQGNQGGGTATEAAILKEASQRRINLINTLAEMNSIVRLGTLKWSNIRFFYTAARVERLTEGNETRNVKVYRRIRVQGRQFEVVKEHGASNTKLKSNEIDGDSSFKLTQKFSRFINNTDWDVTVDARANAVLSKPLQQAKITEMVNVLSLNPAFMAELDPTKAARRYLEVNEEDPRAWLRDNLKTDRDWQLQAMHENVVMASGTPIDPTKDAPDSHTSVHLDYMNSTEYQELVAAQPGIAEIFEAHAFGEHENNPSTGSIQDVMAGEGAVPPEESGGAGGGVGGGATGGASIPGADISPSTVGGEDRRDTQQEQVA